MTEAPSCLMDEGIENSRCIQAVHSTRVMAGYYHNMGFLDHPLLWFRAYHLRQYAQHERLFDKLPIAEGYQKGVLAPELSIKTSALTLC